MDDLISRHDAINAFWELNIELRPSCIDAIIDMLKSLPSAQPDSKELSFTQKKLDTISRQAAIRWVKTECNPYGKPTLDFESGKKVIEHLKQMPSAEPEKRTEERTETHPADREDKVNEPKILDATCGDRTIWFQKNEPHTTYCDIRREEWEGDFGKQLNSNGKKKHRHLVINPDIQCSFTDLPFDDGTFNLVVFDPPHITNLAESSWMRKSYGSLDGDWKPMIHDGFNECMRVLSAGGVLIFKWSDISVSTRDIIKVIGKEPLFGHRSGKKMNTHWMCFMKFDEE